MSVQRRFDRQFKERIKAIKHARLMKKKPELRVALYGSTSATEEPSRPRETAHEVKEKGNG